MSKTENKTFSFDPLGYYEILGVAYNAPEEEIKQNYREKAKVLHPDRNPDENALEKFQKLSVAYDVLKDANSRLIYDLMAQAHPKESFPDINALKAYKNHSGEEDISVRTIALRQVTGKIIKFSDVENHEICNFKEAQTAVLLASISNWFLGWWHPKAFGRNLQALLENFKGINANRQDNFTLLTHNAVAYWEDGKREQALLSALQAGYYANAYQKGLLNKFIAMLNIRTTAKLPVWNWGRLKALQLIIPGFLVLAVLLSLTSRVMTDSELAKYFAKKNEITYFQQVQFRTGGETVDDMVVGRIIDLPADSTDTKLLYHTVSAVNAMHGPSDEFDVMKQLKARQTVRVTGYTPDNIWYRVQIDNGEMGFVRAEFLKKGVGAKIPDGSKVYTGPEI